MELLIVFSWLVCFLAGLWMGFGMGGFDEYYDRIYYSGFKAALRSMSEFSSEVASWVPDEFKDRDPEGE